MKKLTVHQNTTLSHINKEIYGHFSEHLGRCIYDGFYVGKDSEIPNINGVRKDLIDALKEIKIPVLRWPGGCFAEEYHWRDGIGEPDKRPVRLNNYWGGVEETNQFGTHEFFDLCEELGCEPYLAANMSGGTVWEMQSWLEYITYDGNSEMSNLRKQNGREKPWKCKYVGVGNENWGGGGNMRPEFYADEYRKYQTFCKEYSGNKLYKIACGAGDGNYDWTEKVVESIRCVNPYGISLHHYSIPTGNWDKKGSATSFSDDEYYYTVKDAMYMDELIVKHGDIIRKLENKDRPIALIVDEWGVWCDVEEGTNPGFLYQQDSMRDAIVAALTLNIFNKHSDIVKMANLAQTVNVLQSVILTKNEKLIKTPTFYVFKMFASHQENDLLESTLENEELPNGVPALTHSVSVNADGEITATFSNASLDSDFEIELNFDENKGYEVKSCEILTADKEAYNSFDNGDKVIPMDYDGYKTVDGKLILTLPKTSVISIVLK